MQPSVTTPVSAAKVPESTQDLQRVSLLACPLYEAGRAQPTGFCVLEVAEELHLEKTARLRAGDPRRAAPPYTRASEHVELRVQPFETVFGKAVQLEIKYASHRMVSLRVRKAALRSSRHPHRLLLPGRRGD